MSAITPTTFEATFTRTDVREHLRKKCASNFLKKMTEQEKNHLYNRATKTVNAEGEQVAPKPQDEFKNSEWISEIVASWDRTEAHYIPVSVMETIVMKPEAIDALNQKFEAKEVERAEKLAASQAKKAEKKQAKEHEKAEKKLRKAVIKDTVKYITDSDKRVLITDNAEWLAANGITATSVEEYLALITSKEYKKLLDECEGQLEKMSWYQNNHVENNE